MPCIGACRAGDPHPPDTLYTSSGIRFGPVRARFPPSYFMETSCPTRLLKPR